MRYEAGQDSCRSTQFLEWLSANGLNSRDTYAIEVNDDLSATVYEYERDGNGNFFAVGGEIAKKEPRSVRVSSLPPEAIG